MRVTWCLVLLILFYPLPDGKSRGHHLGSPAKIRCFMEGGAARGERGNPREDAFVEQRLFVGRFCVLLTVIRGSMVIQGHHHPSDDYSEWPGDSRRILEGRRDWSHLGTMCVSYCIIKCLV